MELVERLNVVGPIHRRVCNTGDRLAAICNGSSLTQRGLPRGEMPIAKPLNALLFMHEGGFHAEQALGGSANLATRPLFGLFNIGILLTGDARASSAPAAPGVVTGLAIGKPLGIVEFFWRAANYRIAQLSPGISWRQRLGSGCLCGVGFTKLIFIASAAFEGALLDAVKRGVFLGSVVAAAAGCVVSPVATQQASGIAVNPHLPDRAFTPKGSK